MTRGRRSAAPAEVHLHIRRLSIDANVDGAAAAGSAGFHTALQDALAERLGAERVAVAAAPAPANAMTRSIADAVGTRVRPSIASSRAGQGGTNRG
jgi:hypothetical protein